MTTGNSIETSILDVYYLLKLRETEKNHKDQLFRYFYTLFAKANRFEYKLDSDYNSIND